MSYLARLKARISEDAPEGQATKVSKAPCVPFVAPPPPPSRGISLPSELERLIEKVGRAYDTPADEYPLMRDAARRDIEGALQSFRAMAEELSNGD
jgi:hypothetical protein